MKQEVMPQLDGEDGSFWMCLEDFVQKFDSIDICRVSNWDELRLRGRFIRYNDINEPDNEVVVSKWYYALEVYEKSHVIVGLHQEDERAEGTLPRKGYIDFGMALIKRDAIEGSSFIQHKDLSIGRDCEMECLLEPGSYLVVPRTSGCGIKRPQNATDPEGIQLLDKEGNFTEIFESTLIDIFKKFDLVITNSIDFKEFNDFMTVIGKQKVASELEFKT